MTLFQMSLYGAVMIAAVIIVRAIFLEKMPKSVFMFLWAVAVIRLCVPFSLPSALSIYSAFGKSEEQTVPAAQTAMNIFVPAVQPSAEVIQSRASTVGSLSPISILWAAGTALCLIFFAHAYIKNIREFKTSLPVRSGFAENWLRAHRIMRTIEIRQSDRISAPLTYGILRPIILLPKYVELSDGSIDFILEHEFIHIKRFDSLSKLLLTAVVSVHWFNPLVWAMYILANRDMELACDEAVIRRFGEDSRSAYAMTLINMAEAKGCSLFSAFSKNSAEERIRSIMKIKKLTIGSAAAAIVLVTVTVSVFATSPKEPEKTAVSSEGPDVDYEYTCYPVEKVDFNEEGPLLEQYKSFGVSYDKENLMYYDGQPIRYFWDGYDIYEDGEVIGQSLRFEYLNKEGAVDVHAVRDVIENGDGSTNPMGPINGMIKSSKSEFDALDLDSLLVNRVVATYVISDTDGETAYYGDSYAFEIADELVSDYVYTDVSYETSDCSSMFDSSDGGRTFEEIFAEYKDLGVDYRAKEGGRGDVYYNNELVRVFVDETSKSVFTYESDGNGSVSVKTVYDEDGKLTGIEKI